jgi:hypothetical protein
VSDNLFNFFLVSVLAGVSYFYQMTIPWSDYDMLSCRAALTNLEKLLNFISISIRSHRSFFTNWQTSLKDCLFFYFYAFLSDG